MQESAELREARRQEYDDRRDYAIAKAQRLEGEKRLEEMRKDLNCPHAVYEDSLKTQREIYEKNENDARHRWENSKTALTRLEQREEKLRSMREEMNSNHENSL